MNSVRGTKSYCEENSPRVISKVKGHGNDLGQFFPPDFNVNKINSTVRQFERHSLSYRQVTELTILC